MGGWAFHVRAVTDATPPPDFRVIRATLPRKVADRRADLPAHRGCPVLEEVVLAAPGGTDALEERGALYHYCERCSAAQIHFLAAGKALKGSQSTGRPTPSGRSLGPAIISPDTSQFMPPIFILLILRLSTVILGADSPCGGTPTLKTVPVLVGCITCLRPVFDPRPSRNGAGRPSGEILTMPLAPAVQGTR